MSRRRRSEARRDVGGDGGRHSDSVSRGVDSQKGRFISCSHRAGWTCLAPRIWGNYQPYAHWCSHGRKDVDWIVGESATKSADKQSASRSGSARRTECIVERIAPRSEPRSYGSVDDWGPSSTRNEQKWASVSERKIWTKPLVLLARLSGAAAGNCADHCVGKDCSLLLVQAVYIRPRPGALPRGHGELLKLLLNLVRSTHFWKILVRGTLTEKKSYFLASQPTHRRWFFFL